MQSSKRIFTKNKNTLSCENILSPLSYKVVFWGHSVRSRLLFQVLMDFVLETNDAIRRTYLQFTRNVALAQLQRPIGYRFAGVMATFCYYTSYTLPYTWRQLSATGAVDGHIVCSMHAVIRIFIQNRTYDWYRLEERNCSVKLLHAR